MAFGAIARAAELVLFRFPLTTFVSLAFTGARSKGYLSDRGSYDTSESHNRRSEKREDQQPR